MPSGLRLQGNNDMDEALYNKVRDRLEALCARQECCPSDIQAKALKALGGDEAATSKLMSRLVEEKFIDPLRYACAFAREKSSLSGWGKVKISYMLIRKGIARDIVAQAVADINEAKATEKLRSVAAAKYRLLKDDPMWRMKLLRYCLGRGYSYEETAAAIDSISEADAAE